MAKAYYTVEIYTPNGHGINARYKTEQEAQTTWINLSQAAWGSNLKIEMWFYPCERKYAAELIQRWSMA